MTKYYLNGKEVSKEVFEKRYPVVECVDYIAESMYWNEVKEYTCKGPYNDILKIVRDDID